MLEHRTGAAKTIAGVQEAINLRAVARPLFYLVEIPRVGDQRVACLFVGDVAFLRHRLSIAAAPCFVSAIAPVDAAAQ